MKAEQILPVLAADAMRESRADYDTIIQPRALYKLRSFRDKLESAYGHLLSDEAFDWSHLSQGTFQNLWDVTEDWSFKKVLQQLTILNVGDTHVKAGNLCSFINTELDSDLIMKKMKFFKGKLEELELSLEGC